MKRRLALLIIAFVLLNGCVVNRRSQTSDTSQTVRSREKLDFGDYVKMLLLGVLEDEKEDRQRRPNSGVSRNTPEPRYPPQ